MECSYLRPRTRPRSKATGGEEKMENTNGGAEESKIVRDRDRDRPPFRETVNDFLLFIQRNWRLFDSFHCVDPDIPRRGLNRLFFSRNVYFLPEIALSKVSDRSEARVPKSD